MRKTINIITLLILLCGATIYSFRLESFDSSRASSDSAYDSNISKEIEGLLSDNNALRDIIKSNHATNSEAILNNTASQDVPVINEIFDNFFDVYNRALANHDKAKNVEMIASTGNIHAIGNFKGLSVTITGTPYLLMQRNANGEQYCNGRITKMKIPYLASADVYNTYYFSGSKYYTSQYYDQKVYSQRGFLEAYSYSITDLVSVINEDTVTVTNFSYDKHSERYTAKVTFNVDSKGKIMGLDTYTKFLTKLTDNKKTGPAKLSVESRSLSFIINKNCQFVAMAQTEHWSGSLYWAEYNLALSPEVDLSLLWTFSYPKKMSIRKYTF